MKKISIHRGAIPFFCLLILLSVYYIWRMCALAPWYDELYTYFYFINKGPLYSAIHWPLPNNHVFFSVLSAILNYCGIPLIGLRGISLFCSIVNLILIHQIAKRFANELICCFTMLLYASMDLVNGIPQ